MRALFISVIILFVLSGIFIIRKRLASNRQTFPPDQRTYISYQQGDYRESITVDGRKRTYLLHIPYGFDTKREYPLLLGFHGGGGSGEKFAGQTGFNAYADKEGFIEVFPDGIEHNWNDGRDTTDAYKAGVDDVKFVRTLVEDLKTKLPIDKKRIYATGVSNGGIFSHRLGCEMGDMFAAIGSVVASLATNLISRCNPSASLSVLAIQGSVDPFMPLEGGDTEHKTLKIGDGGFVESANSTMKFWAIKNKCIPFPITTRLPLQINDGTWVEQITYAQCVDSTEVRYYIVHGMGHGWPPKRPQAPRLAGPTSQNIDATKVIWEFFSTHPKQ